ncbi:MAG TPA: hypothetical protein VKR06_43365 [Ktedonosporobacter sp.]|nr:hypothetical protein [Ktedonosporobacter sp.]
MQQNEDDQSCSHTRRRFLSHLAGTMALSHPASLTGMYQLVETLLRSPARAEAAAVLLPEQHILQGIQVIQDDGTGTRTRDGQIEVVVPPLYHQTMTARLKIPTTPQALQEAQAHLEAVLRRLEQAYAPTPAGLSITLAWSLPYFEHYIPFLHQSSSYFAAGTRYPDYLPLDHQATAAAGKPMRAILDARLFPSDQPPPGRTKVLLEENHVAILLRSDVPAHIVDGATALFGPDSNQAGSLFELTSIRRGFVGGGFDGAQSLPCARARAAGVAGSACIPQNAELFMGFTSTQKAALGLGRIANLESLPGLTDQWPHGYFLHGTTLHLSHLLEDLNDWYGAVQMANQPASFARRIQAAFRPGLTSPPGTRTVGEGLEQHADVATIRQNLKTTGIVGHSASMQPVTRLSQSVTDPYGTIYPTGTSLLQRSDFNTLDNPFFYSSDPERDGYMPTPAAGLHFATFASTSDLFHRSRLAMDGHYANGTTLDLDPRDRAMGINAFLFTTHRQNFLVPPRVHRSFPLAEFLK